MIKLTCLSTECPERKSVCCGAISGTSMNGERFVCSKCGILFVGGRCTAGDNLPVLTREEMLKSCETDARLDEATASAQLAQPETAEKRFDKLMKKIDQPETNWREELSSLLGKGFWQDSRKYDSDIRNFVIYLLTRLAAGMVEVDLQTFEIEQGKIRSAQRSYLEKEWSIKLK